MNPTGAPEPFGDFCEVVKGLFTLISRALPVGVSPSNETERKPEVSGMAEGSSEMERQPKCRAPTQASGAAEGSGEMERQPKCWAWPRGWAR